MLELIKILPQGYTFEISHENNGIYLLDLRKNTKYAASIYFSELELGEIAVKYDLLDKVKEMIAGIEKLEKGK